RFAAPSKEYRDSSTSIMVNAVTGSSASMAPFDAAVTRPTNSISLVDLIPLPATFQISTCFSQDDFSGLSLPFKVASAVLAVSSTSSPAGSLGLIFSIPDSSEKLGRAAGLVPGALSPGPVKGASVSDPTSKTPPDEPMVTDLGGGFGSNRLGA